MCLWCFSFKTYERGDGIASISSQLRKTSKTNLEEVSYLFYFTYTYRRAQMDSLIVPLEELVRQLYELTNLIMSLIGTLGSWW